MEQILWKTKAYGYGMVYMRPEETGCWHYRERLNLIITLIGLLNEVYAYNWKLKQSLSSIEKYVILWHDKSGYHRITFFFFRGRKEITDVYWKYTLKLLQTVGNIFFCRTHFSYGY